ncbi:hypothetical protein M9Y10_001991 [Tritrichomonas musculus]|uniref:Uncharacterized protein n=1 Tax=Tritrichomonas musculus TaxID=1915356 RepID=A0ABR2L8I5_9EUKA
MNSDSHNREKGESDSNQSYASTIIDEAEIEQINLNNHSLFLENQSLKEQLERALKFTSELDKINAKNTNLLSQLQESNLRIDGLQTKLRIAQQKNQELEEKNKEQYISYQNLQKKSIDNEKSLNETNLKVQDHDSTIKQLNDQISAILNEKNNFIRSFNQLFISSFNSFNQIYNFIETFKNASEKEHSGNLTEKDKQISELKEQITNNQEEYEQNKKLNSALKKKNETLTKKVKAKSLQYKTVKKELNDLKASFEDQSQRFQTLAKNNEAEKDQTQNLQNIINQIQIDRKQEINKFQQIIEAKDSRIHELQERLTNPSHEEDKEYMKAIQELSSVRTEKNQIQQKFQAQLEINQKYKNKLISTSKKIQQYQKEKLILEKKIDDLIQFQSQFEIEENQLKTQLFNTIEQNKSLEQECEHLNSQLKAAAASHIEGESAYNEKQQDSLRFQSALNKIEPILQQQETEITSLAIERKKFVNIIQTQTQILTLYELYTQNQNQKILQYSSKLKNKYSDNAFFQTIESIILPELSPDSKIKINTIISNQNMNNFTKMELICREIISNLKNNNGKLIFKTSLISEITGKKYTKDTFIDFISSQMDSRLNSLPGKSLYQGTYEKRTSALKQLIDEKISMQQLIDLFSAQVIVNILCDKEITELKDQLNSSTLFIDEFHNCFGNLQISDVSNKITSLKQKVKKLKKSNSNASDSYTAELEEKCSQQKEKIHSLEENLRTVVNDATVLQNQLEIKTEQYKSLQNNYEQTQKESSNLYSKHMEELNKYESSLEKRNHDVKLLTSKLSKCTIECEEKTKALQKINDELVQNNATKEEKYQNTVLSLKDQISKLQSQMSEKEQDKRSELLQLAKIQSELKAKLTESIKVMKEQLEENQILSDKLQESLINNENNTKAFQDEINKLTLSKKAIEMQLQSITEQSKREIDVLNSQFNFTALATKTKYQEEMNSLKTKLISDRNNMILTILEEFDELSNIDIDDLNEVDFKIKIKEIAQKYKSLKFRSLCE